MASLWLQNLSRLQNRVPIKIIVSQYPSSDGESSLNGFIKSISKSVGDGAEWRLCGGYNVILSNTDHCQSVNRIAD